MPLPRHEIWNAVDRLTSACESDNIVVMVSKDDLLLLILEHSRQTNRANNADDSASRILHSRDNGV